MPKQNLKDVPLFISFAGRATFTIKNFKNFTTKINLR
jgi:hypothetical protein